MRLFRARLKRGIVGVQDGLADVEYWIPAEDLTALNASIVGTIEVIAEYH